MASDETEPFTPAPTVSVADAPERWREWADEMRVVRRLGVVCTEIAAGRGTYVMAELRVISPNPNGSVHGGLIAAIADEIMGATVMTLVEPGVLPATAALHVQYHRPAITPLTFTATAIHCGRTLMSVETVTTDAEGRRCATCSGTMVVGAGLPRDGDSTTTAGR